MKQVLEHSFFEEFPKQQIKADGVPEKSWVEI